jgi:hypothetical protein
LTNRTSKLIEDAGEEHHGNAKKAKGRRRVEKENRQVSIVREIAAINYY